MVAKIQSDKESTITRNTKSKNGLQKEKNKDPNVDISMKPVGMCLAPHIWAGP